MSRSSRPVSFAALPVASHNCNVGLQWSSAMPFWFKARKPVVVPTDSPASPIAPSTYAARGITGSRATAAAGAATGALTLGGSAQAKRGALHKSRASPVARPNLTEPITGPLFEPMASSVNWGPRRVIFG
jgi:hypothetical protein